MDKETEDAAETWRVKVTEAPNKKAKPPKKEHASKKENAPKKDRKRGKSCNSKCHRKPEPTITGMTRNTKENCCHCCCLMAEYLRAVANLVCFQCSDPDAPRVSEIIKGMYRTASCICHNCLGIIIEILKILIVIKD